MSDKNNSSSLIEDELIEEMTKINNSDENNMEPSFLNQIEAAMENIRVASSHENSPRRNFSNGSNSIDINTENYSTLVEKLKVEKAELEKEKNQLRQQENLLSFSKQNFDLLNAKMKQAKASPHTPKFSSPLLKVSRSPTVELLSEELMKAQQSVEVAEALAGSHQKVIRALKAHTDSGDYSKSPEKMKNFQDSVQSVEQAIMNEWSEGSYKKTAEVDYEYIESLKNAHAKVLEENLELKRNIDDYSILKQKYTRLQEQYKARRKAMLQVKKRQDDAWQFALRALEDKAILQANAHTETIKRLTKQLAKAQELLKSNEFNLYNSSNSDNNNNQDLETLATKCIELESYIVQARKDNIELKSENISLKEKLVTATELGKDALRHAEEKDYLLQSHTKTDEKKLQWLEHGNKKLITKIDQLSAQNDLLKAELYEKSKMANNDTGGNITSNDSAKDNEILFLKEQLDGYLSEVQQANEAVNAWMRENAELKQEKNNAIERLEMANKLSEEYKELVVEMQGKLGKGGNNNTVIAAKNMGDKKMTLQEEEGLVQEIEMKEEEEEEEEELDEITSLKSDIVGKRSLLSSSDGNADEELKRKLKRRLSDVRGIFNTAVKLKLAADLKAVFGVLDKDHDGTISMDELKKGLIKMRVEMDEVEIKFLWDALNVHHNDSISYSDFEHFCHSKSVIAQAAKLGARKRMSRIIYNEAAAIGKVKTTRRSSLVLIKSSGEAAAKLAKEKNVMLEQRNTFKNKMQQSVSLAATVGKQKSLIRSVANSTAQIGKQKILIRKVAGDVALRGQEKRHGRNVASHAATVAIAKKRRRSIAVDAAALAKARTNIKQRRASITKQDIKDLRIPDSPLKISPDMQINRRISEVRNVFNTAVTLKLAADLKAVFGVLDKDHDGTISMDELKKGLIKMRVEMDEVEIKFLWDALNVHHNDSISYSDFEHFCHSKSVIAQAAAIGNQKRAVRDAALYAAEIATSKMVVQTKTRSSPQKKTQVRTITMMRTTTTTTTTRTRTTDRSKKRRKVQKDTFLGKSTRGGKIKNISSSTSMNNTIKTKKLNINKTMKNTTMKKNKARKTIIRKTAASKSILNPEINKDNNKFSRTKMVASKKSGKVKKNVNVNSKKNNSSTAATAKNVKGGINISNNMKKSKLNNSTRMKYKSNLKKNSQIKLGSRRKVSPTEGNNKNTKAAALLNYKPILKAARKMPVVSKKTKKAASASVSVVGSSLSKSSSLLIAKSANLKKKKIRYKASNEMKKSKSSLKAPLIPKEKVIKRDLSKRLIPTIKIEDIPDKPFKELLSSPHKPVVLKDYKSYTVDEYKWLDKGMSPGKRKITYQAYKGPVGELNVKSSFGKPKSASTSKKKKKSPYQDDDDLSKLLSSNGNSENKDIVKMLNFNDKNNKINDGIKKFKVLKVSKASPYAQKTKKTGANITSLSLNKYEMSKRARRLNYKPILDDDTNNKNKGRRKKVLKSRNKASKPDIDNGRKSDSVHNPANVALSPPPPSLPPARSSVFFGDNTNEDMEGNTPTTISVQSPELSENDIKKLEDDVTKLFRKKYRRLRKTKKKNLSSSKISELRKEFSVIKYGYASKYATSQTKSIRKQKRVISRQLKSLRKKQKMLDDSIQNLNIDGSPIPYSISTKVYSETHGRGHHGLVDHNGQPFK